MHTDFKKMQWKGNLKTMCLDKMIEKQINYPQDIISIPGHTKRKNSIPEPKALTYDYCRAMFAHNTFLI